MWLADSKVSIKKIASWYNNAHYFMNLSTRLTLQNDLLDRLSTELLTGSIVPGIKSSAKGVVPKVAPVSITIYWCHFDM